MIDDDKITPLSNEKMEVRRWLDGLGKFGISKMCKENKLSPQKLEWSDVVEVYRRIHELSD